MARANLKNLFTGAKDPDLAEKGAAEAIDAGAHAEGAGGYQGRTVGARQEARTVFDGRRTRAW